MYTVIYRHDKTFVEAHITRVDERQDRWKFFTNFLDFISKDFLMLPNTFTTDILVSYSTDFFVDLIEPIIKPPTDLTKTQFATKTQPDK